MSLLPSCLPRAPGVTPNGPERDAEHVLTGNAVLYRCDRDEYLLGAAIRTVVRPDRLDHRAVRVWPTETDRQALDRVSLALKIIAKETGDDMAATPGRTPRDLRRANRVTVLRRLYFDGPATRVELAGRTGLSAATVTNVITDLIAAGLVLEAGQRGSAGGRPAILGRVEPDHGAVVGVDVGETGAA